MTRPRFAGPLAALVIVALATSVGLVAAATKPKAWIDQPLPGAVLPVGPTAVTIHAAAPFGIVKVRALVDGLPVAELPAPTGDLVTIPWTWPVEIPGERLLTVVAEGTDGLTSDPVSVVVTFVAPRQPGPDSSTPPSPGESAAASATPPPSTSPSTPPRSTPGPSAGPTPAPTPKPTPSPPPCIPDPPILDAPIDFVILQPFTSVTFSWHYAQTPTCLAGQRLVINVPDHLYDGQDTLEIELGGRLRQKDVPDGFLPDPEDGQGCGHYHWWIVAFNADGDGEPSAPGSFRVCEGRSG